MFVKFRKGIFNTTYKAVRGYIGIYPDLLNSVVINILEITLRAKKFIIKIYRIIIPAMVNGGLN